MAFISNSSELIFCCCITVPIATLILGPNKFEHTDYYKDKDGGDLCDNVTCLGNSQLDVVEIYVTMSHT